VDLTTITLLAFAALTLIVVGMLLVVRDILSALRRGRTKQPAAEVLPHVSLEKEASLMGTRGRIDRAFGRLIIDAGLELSLEAAFLVMVLVGVSLSAAVFLAFENELIALTVMPLGMLIPLCYYVYARARRLKLIYEQLPGALATMSRAVRAGESVEDALRLSGQTAEEPLATELRRCAGHLAMGLSMAATMRSLTWRIRIQELKILSSALVVQRASGGNLSDTLERVIALIRDRQAFRRQFLAGTAGARMAAGLVIVALPVYLLFMALYGQEYVGFFFREPLGWGLFVGGLGLLLAGLLWILSLLKVDY
jgi:tight adherence protein B